MCEIAHSSVWGLVKGVLSILALLALGYFKVAGYIKIRDGRTVVVR